MSPRTAFPKVLLNDVGNTANGQAIAERIASSISLGILSVGERLPNEMELAAEFGVAVATLRKALATLRDDGIVETRRGRSGGTFIVRSPYPVPSEMSAMLENTSVVELRDLGDEHAAVAGATARLACSRVYTGSLDRLTSLAVRVGEVTSPAQRSTADSRFHIELGVLAQSPRLLRAEVRLQSESAPLLWANLGAELSPENAVAEHLALVEAIRDDRAELAEQLAAEHVRKNVYHLIDTKLSLHPGADSAETAVHSIELEERA